MKKFILLFCLVFLVGASGGLAQIKVSAQIAKGYYFSPMPSGSSIEYKIWVDFRNTSSRTMEFDSVRIYWLVGGGSMGSVTASSEGDIFKLAAGKSREFYFATNGYTHELLANKGKESIRVVVVLTKGNQVVLEAQVATVPELDKLPDLGAREERKDELPWLKFSIYQRD